MRISRRSKLFQPSEPISSPAWIITYADFVTLLLCLFIALLSMSTIKKDRFDRAAGSLQASFGLTPASAAPPPMDIAEALDRRLSPRESSSESPEERLERRGWILARTAHGTKLVVGGPAAFPKGVADISNDLLPILVDAAVELRDRDCRLVIQGYSAAETPHNPPTSASMLDLSYQRAAIVARLLEQAGIPPDKTMVVAGGEKNPLFDHSYTERRRRLNRRVEIEIIESADTE